MIEPQTSNPLLISEIADTEPDVGTLAIWWLGQSGYLIKSSQGILVIDPYLSEHLTTKYAKTDKPHIRMTRTPFRGADLVDVDLVLASHKHSDHLDPGTLPDLMDASEAAILALPLSLVAHATSLGIEQDRMIGLSVDRTIRVAGFSVRPIPAAHESLDTDPKGHPLYMGFVIEAEGLRLYHSGDCIRFPQLLTWLGAPETSYDLAILPINGRDPARGVSGNMTTVEAISLAIDIKSRYVIPCHYDMFTFNTVPISEFIAEAKSLPDGVRPQVLHVGERWILSQS